MICDLVLLISGLFAAWKPISGNSADLSLSITAQLLKNQHYKA
jgi:hypothetical protein